MLATCVGADGVPGTVAFVVNVTGVCVRALGPFAFSAVALTTYEVALRRPDNLTDNRSLSASVGGCGAELGAGMLSALPFFARRDLVVSLAFLPGCRLRLWMTY